MNISVLTGLATEETTGANLVDLQQNPVGWTFLRLGFRVEFDVSSDTTPTPSYFQIKNRAGTAGMEYRAISGGYGSNGCTDGTKFSIEFVVKGSDIGGASPTNDVVLGEFVRDEYTINAIERHFFVPVKSLLLYTSAADYSEQLPDVPVYWRITLTAPATSETTHALNCFLEGFEPPPA